MKANLVVSKSDGHLHLMRDASGAVHVDARKLSIDFRNAYKLRIRTPVFADDALAERMTQRLNEIVNAYRSEERKLNDLELPHAPPPSVGSSVPSGPNLHQFLTSSFPRR